mgnify:CR=1 FL=1
MNEEKGVLKKEDNIYKMSFGDKLRDFAETAFDVVVPAFMGLVMLAPLALGVTGSVLKGINQGKINSLQEIVDTYKDSATIVNFVEDNFDKEQLYGSNPQDVVLDVNDWGRLKKLYDNTIVTSQAQYEAGEISLNELEQAKTNFADNFRTLVTLNQYMEMTENEGILKEYNEAEKMVDSSKIMEAVGYLATPVTIGAVVFAGNKLSKYEGDERGYDD